ncbi:MAG: substrate-binding domain-containing protein [Planctomycetes bacterium]|nr:substrate-binding domain-containing protein [Planctomycetota bacterium]
MHPILRVSLILSVAALIAAAETVIVHPGNAAASLSKDDLDAIYNGKKANWPDGAKIVIAVMDGPVHESFLKAYVGKTSAQFSASWKKIVFTGKAKAPQECKDDAAMAAFVAATPGAIGYVSDAAAAGGAKVVAVQ